MRERRDEVHWTERPRLPVGPGRALPKGLEKNDYELFDYQERAVDALAKWFEGEQRAGVLCLPTGAGKTRTAVDFALKHAFDRKNQVLWLCHRNELMNQAIEVFASRSHLAPHPFSIGRFGATGETTRTKDFAGIFVAMIPSLQNENSFQQLWSRIQNVKLVIVDECHHGAARTWIKLIHRLREQNPELKILGLSATPRRGNDREQLIFWKLFEGVIYEERVLKLIEQRYLAKPELTPVRTDTRVQLSASEFKDYERFGELPESVINRIAADEARNELAVRTFLKSKEKWGQTLIFVARVEQARRMAARLNAENVNAAYVSGEDGYEERKRIFQDFKLGRIQVIVNVLVASEGTDLPGVETVFLVRPTRSQTLFQQMVGRGMRGPKVGGSDYCRIVSFQDEIVDMVENKLTHHFAGEAAESWEAAQLIELQLLEGVEEEEGERSKKRESDKERDGDESSEREELAQKIREKLIELGFDWDADRTELQGWWSLPLESRGVVGRRAYALPIFEGDEELNAQVERLAAAIIASSEESVPMIVANWVKPPLVRRFWRRANQIAIAPIYRTIESAADLEDFAEEWSSWGDEDKQESNGSATAPSAPVPQPSETQVDFFRDLVERSALAHYLELDRIGSEAVLEGWWTLPIAPPGSPPVRQYALPIFHGDSELHGRLTELSEQIESGTSKSGRRAPKSRWIQQWVVNCFWNLAHKRLAPPRFRKIDEVDISLLEHRLDSWLREDDFYTFAERRLASLHERGLKRFVQECQERGTSGREFLSISNQKISDAEANLLGLMTTLRGREWSRKYAKQRARGAWRTLHREYPNEMAAAIDELAEEYMREKLIEREAADSPGEE